MSVRKKMINKKMLRDIFSIPMPMAYLICVLSIVSTIACSKQKFAPMDQGSTSDQAQSTPDEEILSNFYKISSSETNFQQDILDQNKTSLSFQVQLPDGTYLNDLLQSQISIKENGVNVNGFSLTSNSQNIVQTVDIVFAVDITGSMTSTIESAKTRLVNFTKTTRDRGFHTRMCLITFGDYTVKNCDKFYDNDPNDPSTQAQVDELVSEITKLKALKGKQDPGGKDLNENPMRALIDASKAPWGTDSQRFLILITDDGFLYSPGNSGAVGALAPQYTEVMDALAQSEMKVFAATPSLAGYNKPFKGNKDIVSLSQGEFFLYSDLIKGKITLDTILNRIISRVKTTYFAEYVVEQTPSLNPSLPLNKRNIQVVLNAGISGKTIITSTQSNLPTGRPEYKKSWKLSDKKIRGNSVAVKVNNANVSSGYKIVDGSLVFDQTPDPGAKIEVQYQYADLKDSVQLKPLVLNKQEKIRQLEIYLNGKLAADGDIIFEKNLEDGWSVSPADEILSDSDPYEIQTHNGLEIKIIRKGK